jgi:ribonuclease BN (tRNA processing enzyme)
VKFTLIPSSVSPHAPPQQFLASCLVNDVVALDAGCIGFYRTPQDQAAIRHVLLSHSHLDHLASLPMLVEQAGDSHGEGITIHASQAVLDCCQRDLFNDRLWPDFVALSRSGRALLKLAPLEAGQTIELEGLRITAVALDHVVPTVGYLISDGRVTVAHVSDTGPTEEIWRRCNAAADLKAVFLEAAFPNALGWLAHHSKHLTPALLAAEVSKLSRPVRVIVIHVKPRYQAEVHAEVRALGLANVEIGRFDIPYEF